MLRGSYAAQPACSQPPDQTFPWILHLCPFHSQQDVDFSDLSAPCLHVFLGELSKSDDEFEPFRPLSLGAELSPAQEIAFGDDTDQFAFLIEVPASR